MLRHQHDDPQYFLDGDAPVSGATVRALVRQNIIRLATDGLFGGDGQTYVLTEGAA